MSARLPLNGLSWSLIIGAFLRVRPETANLVKFGQKYRQFTWRPKSRFTVAGNTDWPRKHNCDTLSIFILFSGTDLNNTEKALLLISSLTMVRQTCHRVTLDITTATQQSPSWGANRPSVSPEIPQILWNPNVHHHIQKSLKLSPILIQTDPVHVPLRTFLRVNLILS